MSVTIEKIEELRKRASIGYEEAKILLERHNGDILEALIELEKQKKINPHYHCHENFHKNIEKGRFSSKIKELFSKGNRTKFLVTKNGSTVVDVPVNFVVVSFILGFHLLILSLILIFVTGCKMSVKKAEGQTMDMDDVIVDVSKKVKNAAKSFSDEGNASPGSDAQKKADDGYNEYTVK